MLEQFKPVADGRFIEFRPSGEDFKLAAERSERMGVLANSYTRGAGRMSGMLGEIAVEKYLGGIIDHCGEFSKSSKDKFRNHDRGQNKEGAGYPETGIFSLSRIEENAHVRERSICVPSCT